MTPRPQDEEAPLDEQGRLRRRIHNLADTVHDHGGMLTEHRILIDQCEERLKETRGEMATRDQLKGMQDSMLLRLDAVNMQLEPIKRGIYWVVTVVIGAVIVAVLALVIHAK